MPDTATSTLLLQSIVTIATGSTAAAAVGAVVSHRKTRAEVGKTEAETGRTEAEIVGVGTTTAATQVDTAMDMLREMRTDLAAMRVELAANRVELANTRRDLTAAVATISVLERWKSDHELRMTDHGVWDAEVVQQLRELGGDIRSAPPLGVPPIRPEPPRRRLPPLNPDYPNRPNPAA